MAKTSSIQKNKRRMALVKQMAPKRERLKAMAKDEALPFEERFAARLKLAEMPRNGAAVRVRLRCEVSGRSRANYRKLGISRIAMRELGSKGMIPGLVKSSW